MNWWTVTFIRNSNHQVFRECWVRNELWETNEFCYTTQCCSIISFLHLSNWKNACLYLTNSLEWVIYTYFIDWNYSHRWFLFKLYFHFYCISWSIKRWKNCCCDSKMPSFLLERDVRKVTKISSRITKMYFIYFVYNGKIHDESGTKLICISVDGFGKCIY